MVLHHHLGGGLVRLPFGVAQFASVVAHPDGGTVPGAWVVAGPHRVLPFFWSTHSHSKASATLVSHSGMTMVPCAIACRVPRGMVVCLDSARKLDCCNR